MPKFEYTVTEAEAEHYNQIRITRGWSWETLADYFDQCGTDPTAPFFATWARSQTEAIPTKRAAKKGTERTTAAPPEKR